MHSKTGSPSPMRLASLLLLLLAGAATARHLNAANSLRPAPPTEDVEDNDPAPWRVHPRALREVSLLCVRIAMSGRQESSGSR